MNKNEVIQVLNKIVNIEDKQEYDLLKKYLSK